MKRKKKLSEDFIIDNRMKIAESIKSFREVRGYSQDELADIMNITRSTISKIENGKFAFSIDYILKFSWYLDFNLTLTDNK